MAVPDWVQDAIFYQIFPDRFANGNRKNDPPNVMPWGSPPTVYGFQGGDLAGILQRFDYLLDLGINAIYLNPIFQSSSTHRFNTTDYLRVDPILGSMGDFCELMDLAHRNGVRVILDGVFSRCGRGFFAFSDILENRQHSPYKDWFHEIMFPEDVYEASDEQSFLALWGAKGLPKFNTGNSSVRRYLLDVARYWIEQGADGWRLDAPFEIKDESFWAEFCAAVKEANPDAYLVGEAWMPDPSWTKTGFFDGLMNYPVRDALLRLLYAQTLCTSDFADRVEGLLKTYPLENSSAMYVPLGSHDTERLLTKLGGNLELFKLAMMFQFSFPGAPAIYYGDEIGMTGGLDPDNRGAFPWEPENWNEPLHDWVKSLIAARKRLAPLRRGDYQRLLVDDYRCLYAFTRAYQGQAVTCVLNGSGESHFCTLPLAGPVQDVFSGQEFGPVEGGVEIQLPAYGGVWLVNNL